MPTDESYSGLMFDLVWGPGGGSEATGAWYLDHIDCPPHWLVPLDQVVTDHGNQS